ncbi:unnamed protein product [Lactuca virosa]|uniref:Malectin-like domain-containing protein n=1 Tax=Lactuca virosa TaxID=75947 RepID=A0AAU9MJY2_9ASTR|nr:unnamed protein product [Lactuca virosa]
MFTFRLPLFSFLLLFSTTTTTTTAQPYKPTDYFLLNCGGESVTSDHRKWDTDERSKFIPSTTSFTSTPNYHNPSIPEIPYYTARLFNTSSFTYTFPVITNGPKFLRLYFYPATYSGYQANQSYFSVSSNGYTLLSNFSAFLTASYLGTNLADSSPLPYFIKEYVIYVNDTQSLNVTFTPSPNSYAFINGIEIVSLPENLYYKSKNMKCIGLSAGPMIKEYVGLENIYRLNVGGIQIPPTGDTGMYRLWDQDDRYLFSAPGVTQVYKNPITYTAETPNYTAPEVVYATQRSMGKLSKRYNLTWLLPVDSGFYYMLRLHFCSIILEYTRKDAVIFKIFINNQTAEDSADLFYWTQGTGFPVFKDYVVYVFDSDGSGRKQDLWLAMAPDVEYSEEYSDAFLNGLEVFKLSMNRSLAGPNPELQPTPPSPSPPSPTGKKKTPPYAAIIGGIGGALVLMLSVLGFIVFRRVKRSGDKSDEQKSKDSGLPSGRCRRPVVIKLEDPEEVVSLAEWGRSNYGNGTLHEIVDKRISDEIAPNSLMKFGEVANSCLRSKGSKRPNMEEVVWGLEFALQLQLEAAEKIDGEVAGEMKGGSGMSGNQEFMFPVKGEDVSVVEEYEYELEESTGVGIQHGLTSTDGSSHEVCVSETVLPR